jgi:hypothetical protein
MISSLKNLNLALRGIMEFGIIAGLAYWGFQTGETTIIKIALCISAPLLIFGFWGLVDFRNAGRFAEYYRLTQEMIICIFNSALIYSTGQHVRGWILLIISTVHHVLVYFLGERLLG